MGQACNRTKVPGVDENFGTKRHVNSRKITMEIVSRNSEHLGYFHDAIVQRLDFVCTANGVKAIVLKLLLNPECGFPTWNGKTCALSFQNPQYLTGDFFLISDSWDQVNGIDFTDKSAFGDWVKRGSLMGLSEPRLYLAINFASGSTFYICCDCLSVDFIDGTVVESQL